MNEELLKEIWKDVERTFPAPGTGRRTQGGYLAGLGSGEKKRVKFRESSLSGSDYHNHGQIHHAINGTTSAVSMGHVQ